MRRLRFAALALAVAGCAAGQALPEWGSAARLEARGDLAGAAEAYERLAKTTAAGTRAEAWYRAGRLWASTGNPRRSYDRALRCLRNVDLAAATTRTARETRTLRAMLEREAAARGAAADIDRGAEAVRSR
jgi:hypothetical protein